MDSYKVRDLKLEGYNVFEVVLKGHPDTMIDMIVERVMNKIIERDPDARCAIEGLIKQLKDDGDLVIVLAGEVTANFDYKSLVYETVYEVLSDIGHPLVSVDGHDKLIVINLVSGQSEDINKIVSGKTREEKGVGVGDNGIIYGGFDDIWTPAFDKCKLYADKVSEYIRDKVNAGDKTVLPDGKVLFYFDQSGYLERVVHNQHITALGSGAEEVFKTFLWSVVDELFDDQGEEILLNPNGPFTVGGPLGDSGVSGRKLACNTSGGTFRNGGGALFGKDYSKADRSVSIYLADLAKQVVANDKYGVSAVEFKVACVIGDPYITIKVSGYDNAWLYPHNDEGIKSLFADYNGLRVKYEDVVRRAKELGLKWYGL